MTTEYTEARIREARLIVARPEQVLVELEKYNDDMRSEYGWDKNLEESLLARNEPLIDLGLARYAREEKVVAALYKKSRVTPTDRLQERYLYGLRVACLSNEVATHGFSKFPENILGEEETARLIKENKEGEIAALLSNRKFSHRIEALYKNEGLFSDLTDERRRRMVATSIDNPRLTEEDSAYDYDSEYVEIHKAILSMIASAPTTDKWIYTLRALLDKLDPGNLKSPADGPITPILERWAHAPASEKKDASKEGDFTNLSMRDEFRCLVAAMYGHHFLGKDDKLASSNFSLNLEGEILRCAYYGQAEFKFTEKDMESGYARDQNVYLLAVLCNDTVYRQPALRNLLEEQLRDSLSRRGEDPCPILWPVYRGRCEQIHKRHPDFDPLPISDPYLEQRISESKELTMIKQLEATVASIANSVKSVRTSIFWGFLVLGALVLLKGH